MAQANGISGSIAGKHGEECVTPSAVLVDPLLVVRRRSFDSDMQPVEWGTSWFRGDRITARPFANAVLLGRSTSLRIVRTVVGLAPAR